ncbi:MAG TPA: hypothetical protein VFS47_17615 [Steroidobacteraceae bacterium]|jgi:hypothetical protein|nr:hypothetical protein [Steroidobacteraceae bacterium]
MKLIIRIVLLGVMVVLGVTIVFPEWFDFRDQLVAEHWAEKAAANERSRRQDARRSHEEVVAQLKARESQAVEFSRGVWNDVSSGDYASLFRHGAESLQAENTQENLDQLQAIYSAVGRELTADEAAQMAGYDSRRLESEYLDAGMADLVTQVRYWGENALCVQTLHLKVVEDRLAVDWALVEVLLYHGKENLIPETIRSPHVFRGT